jgi:plasmid stabilization system protein ParE
MTYQFTTSAKEDIVQLELYLIDVFSLDRAQQVIDAIVKQIELLLTFPELGKVPLYRSLRVQQYRYLIIEKQYIFYKVLGESMIIVRILHQKKSLRLL